MSYCRYGEDSDVYLIQCSAGYECKVSGGRTGFLVKTPKAALRKLLALRSGGLKVPQRAIDRLEHELAAKPSQ
jgi:hypothetical protein